MLIRVFWGSRIFQIFGFDIITSPANFPSISSVSKPRRGYSGRG